MKGIAIYFLFLGSASPAPALATGTGTGKNFLKKKKMLFFSRLPIFFFFSPTAVHTKPFSPSVLQGLSGVFATTTKICTTSSSSQVHTQSLLHYWCNLHESFMVRLFTHQSLRKQNEICLHQQDCHCMWVYLAEQPIKLVEVRFLDQIKQCL